MSGVNVVFLLLLVIGHATLCVSLMNRIHSFPWPEYRLKRFRHLLKAAVVGFPAVLFFCSGVGPYGESGEGSWYTSQPWWWLVVSVCGVGVFVLIAKIVRHQFRQPIKQLVHKTASVFNIEKEFGQRLIGNGPYRYLARLPGNEQFCLEVSEQILVLPQLPDAWDGLSILHLSDWHFSGTVRREYYERVTEILNQKPVDLVCFTGDLIDDVTLVDWIPSTLGRLTGRIGQYFILGNHDWLHESELTRMRLAESGWVDLSSRVQVLEREQARLAVAGDETPWMGSSPEFPNDVDFRLLLSHTPDNVFRARRNRVDLMLSGHNHGGQVRLPIIGPVFSPSWYGCRYASGLFDESPTLMVVSRGLSGLHPLRYRCLPEVSRLTLRSK